MNIFHSYALPRKGGREGGWGRGAEIWDDAAPALYALCKRELVRVAKIVGVAVGWAGQRRGLLVITCWMQRAIGPVQCWCLFVGASDGGNRWLECIRMLAQQHVLVRRCQHIGDRRWWWACLKGSDVATLIMGSGSGCWSPTPWLAHMDDWCWASHQDLQFSVCRVHDVQIQIHLSHNGWNDMGYWERFWNLMVIYHLLQLISCTWHLIAVSSTDSTHTQDAFATSSSWNNLTCTSISPHRWPAWANWSKQHKSSVGKVKGKWDVWCWWSKNINFNS